jgi:hypothetical protein
MSADIQPQGHGFHKLVFKVDGGRSGMANVTVMISQDAHRKLVSQMQRARFQLLERSALLKAWAIWEIADRLEEQGVMPGTVTITATDLDEFGAYASDMGRKLQAG